MKFEIIGENNYNDNAIQTIFQNRGVHDFETLLNVDKSHTHHWSLLANIKEAAKCLLEHLNKGHKIFVKVDSDCDGYSSSTILINYILKIFPNANIEWQLQEGKEHGIKVEDIPEDVDVVIIPDAGTNQDNEHKQLFDKGIDVIVLDHHEADYAVRKYAIVVNNQLSPMYPNKNFSGAGIVYKFCEALDTILNVSYAEEFLDLVAVGNIGDMMDLRELETRYYVKEGLKQIKNPLLKAIIEKQEYSMGSVVNINNIAFYVVPLINAAVRFGTKDEKVAMMKSFLGHEEQVYYERNDEFEDFHTSVARALTNIRSRQNRPKAKSVPIIETHIKETEMLDDKAFVIDVTKVLDKTLTGLVANQIARKYRRPIIFLRKQKNGLYGGSARGYGNGEVKDFRQFLLNSNLFNMCEGHDNAFGIEIKAENIEELHKYINNNLTEEIEFDSYEVDFIIKAKDLTRNLIGQIAAFRDEWGSVLNEPKIAIVDLSFSYDDITLHGKKKNILKMNYNGIEFIKYFYNEEKFKSTFAGGDNFYMDVLGKFKINEWQGNQTPQVVIEEFDVEAALPF